MRMQVVDGYWTIAIMTTEKITLDLPSHILQRLARAANVLAMTREDVLSETISLMLPAIESDLEPDEELELTKLLLLSDMDLWKVAHGTFEEQKQYRLENLAERQKKRPLTKAEQNELSTLMAEAQKTMLTKAEAYRLLSVRGHTVFPKMAN